MSKEALRLLRNKKKISTVSSSIVKTINNTSGVESLTITNARTNHLHCRDQNVKLI